jgi:hypothetical protein
MSTTNLFVELLVIGVGAGTWLMMLVLSALGVRWLSLELLQSYAVLFIGLAFVYVLGVISDRIADFVFDKLFSTPIRKKHFATKRDYQDARRVVFRTSDRLADQHEYGRIRIRVARGWAINALMIAGALQVFIRAQFPHASWSTHALGWGTVGLLMLAVGCWWSWSMLCSTEYLKIKEHAAFLKTSAALSIPQSSKAA